MQFPIMNGVYADLTGAPRTSYPRNLIPVPKKTGVSDGFLQPGDGLVQYDNGVPGVDRGGINWNGQLYRVLGSKLCFVDTLGNVSVIGDVGNDGNPVFMDYSFTYLAIASNGNLFYYDGVSNFFQVTDPNVGQVISLIWVDNYFLLCDSQTIVVTNLSDPTTINPLEYGSAEADPDPNIALLKVRNEATVVGRYTIEVLQDIGGSLFPFQRIDGAEVLKGAVGRKTCCVFIDQVAFLGSGRNEPCAVYLAVNGVYTKISTMEIDTIIQEYSENQLAGCVLEARIEKSHAWLYLHLPNATYVYDFNASQITGEPFWFQLDSALGDTPSQYQARFLVWVYDKWIFGDPTAPRLGTFSLTDGSAYGEDISWQFQTVMIYNHGPGLIVHELELMAITGAVKWATKPTLSTSYSFDGITWSQDRTRSAGKQGQRDKRLNWLACGSVRRWRIQRFKGTSAAHMSFLALEARISPLAW